MKIILTTTIILFCAIAGFFVYHPSQVTAESSVSKFSEKTLEKPKKNPQIPPKASDKTEKPAHLESVTKKQPDADGEKADSHEIPVIYQNYAKVLAKYVDKNGGVNYAKLRRKRADLSDAIQDIANVSPLEYHMKWNDNEKKAFWINAHNLFTIKLIIDNYPIEPLWYQIFHPAKSIKQIPKGRDGVYFDVLGLEYTILEIEQERLLEQFDDLRIIFTLTQASKSSPFLRNEPYVAHTIDKQLNEQVSKFLSSPIGMKIKDNELYISGIFSWYRKYFLESKYSQIKKFRKHSDHNRTYLNFIFEHADKKTVSLLESQDFTIETLSYDWQLNEPENK